MKKNYLILLLALTLTFSGCGKDEEKAADAVSDTATETPAQTESPEEETEDIQEAEIVGVQYFREGEYSIPFDENDSIESSYSYNVPMITDGSEEATKINQEIYAFCQPSIDAVESILADNSPESYMDPQFIDISYEAFENGDIVSIVMRGAAVYSDWCEYYVVNYNRVAKMRVENEDLIQNYGLSLAEFTSKAKGSIGNAVRDDLIMFIGADGSVDLDTPDEENEWRYRMIADFSRNLAESVNDKNVNTDMPVYIDGDGDLSVVGLIFVPAGAGQYYYQIKIEDYELKDVAKTFVEYAEKYHYDGFEKDCLSLFEIEGYSATITHNVATGNEYSEDMYMGFNDTDPSQYLLQFVGDGYGICFSGTLKLIDIDENGLKFAYELNERDNKPLESDECYSGSFYLSPYSYYDEAIEDIVSGCRYKYVDGDDMLDTQGTEIELEKSFG